MKLQEYLHRIGYAPDVKANLETLRGLQFAHMLSVPFENLDIGLDRPILLDEKSLWDKLITRQRGGFCYELNGLFAWLLKEIGYEVTYLNARDYHEKDDTFGIDFDHLTLMVHIPKDPTRWLVDVGWGDSFTEPLNLDDPNEQVQGARGYWLEQFNNGYQLWQRDYDGSHERQYFFDIIPHRFPDEYLDACLYHQSSPQSIFTRKRIISRLTEDGRVSLDNDKLIVTSNGNRTTQEVKEDDRGSILKKYFNVIL
ncbi:MAG: arylamine N-acetyltransferase [Chloroflexi bacterium]|nr:arylamine N-acetyltransferase [Chloroflexota bacterium]